MMTATAAPIPSFALGHPQTAPALPFTASLPIESLTERHRPATLADVVGQGAAVFQLETFLEAPVSTAFLFSGPTGVGKTTVARALANDLGVSPDWGFLQINSARADAEAVDDALRLLRHSCPVGSGWRLVVIDEADLMTPKASHLWLSALEDLPPRAVVVFTTNRPDAFPDRFTDRCQHVEFASAGDLLSQDAQTLIDRVWRAETGRDDAPRVAEIPSVVDRHGRLSFRRVVAALDPMVRAALKQAGSSPHTVQAAPPTVPIPPKPLPAPKPAPAAIKTAERTTPAERPATVPMMTPTDDRRRAINKRLAALEREYNRMGDVLLAMDSERDALKAERAKLDKSAKRV